MRQGLLHQAFPCRERDHLVRRLLAQRIEAEHRQEIRGTRAERASWTIGISSVVLGYGSMFLLGLNLQCLEGWRWPPGGAFGYLLIFGGTVLSGAYFVLLIIVWGIREWLQTPPSDR